MNSSERNMESLKGLLLEGPKTGQTQAEWAERARAFALAVQIATESEAKKTALDDGIGTTVPVEIAAPLVTPERIKADKAAHKAEIEAVARRNKAVLTAAAGVIMGGVAVVASGNPSGLIEAVLNAAKQVRDALGGTDSPATDVQA